MFQMQGAPNPFELELDRQVQGILQTYLQSQAISQQEVQTLLNYYPQYKPTLANEINRRSAGGQIQTQTICALADEFIRGMISQMRNRPPQMMGQPNQMGGMMPMGGFGMPAQNSWNTVPVMPAQPNSWGAMASFGNAAPTAMARPGSVFAKPAQAKVEGELKMPEVKEQVTEFIPPRRNPADAPEPYCGGKIYIYKSGENPIDVFTYQVRKPVVSSQEAARLVMAKMKRDGKLHSKAIVLAPYKLLKIAKIDPDKVRDGLDRLKEIDANLEPTVRLEKIVSILNELHRNAGDLLGGTILESINRVAYLGGFSTTSTSQFFLEDLGSFKMLLDKNPEDPGIQKLRAESTTVGADFSGKIAKVTASSLIELIKNMRVLRPDNPKDMHAITHAIDHHGIGISKAHEHVEELLSLREETARNEKMKTFVASMSEYAVLEVPDVLAVTTVIPTHILETLGSSVVTTGKKDCIRINQAADEFESIMAEFAAPMLSISVEVMTNDYTQTGFILTTDTKNRLMAGRLSDAVPRVK